MMVLRLRSRGDTIVEVLIAIAIVGAVLGGAYLSANQSLQAERRSQERSEALKIAEQQLELLRVASTEGSAIFSGGQHFCLESDRNRHDLNGAPPADFRNDNFTELPTGNYPGECVVAVGDYGYYIWVNRIATDTFEVRVRWNGIGGQKQQAQLNYRVHAV